MSGTRFDPAYPTIEDKDSDGRVTFERDDIPDSQKLTLRSYLKSLSEGKDPSLAGNPVAYDGQVPPNHANPFTISAMSGSSPQPSFTSQPGLEGAVDRDDEPSLIFGDDLDSILRPPEPGVASSTLELSGHELLAGIQGAESPDGETVTTAAGSKKYVETLATALAAKNLNHGDARFADGNTDGPSTAQRVRLDDTLAGANMSTSYDTADIKRVKEKDLHGIAQKMMSAAMGGKRAQQGVARVPSSVTRAAAAAAGKGELGNLNRTMLNRGDDNFEAGEDGGGTATYTGESWPVAYSPEAPYTGFTTLSDAFTAFVISGHFLAAVLGAAALGALIPAIGKALIPAEVNSGTRSSRKLQSGKFRYVAEDTLGGLAALADVASNLTGLSIPSPIYLPTNPLTGYPACVIAGLASFLGVSYDIDPDIIVKVLFFQIDFNTPILAGKIALRILAIFADPASRQYYMNIIRELNRDTVALGGALNDVSLSGGVLSGAGSALNAVSSIFDSKLFKFVNTLAAIGDLAYTQAAAIDLRKTEIEVDPDVAYSSFDATNPAMKVLMGGFGSRRIYGNRLSRRRGVTYAISDLPSYHLIPAGESQAYRGLLGAVTSPVAKRMTSVKPDTSSGRLRFTPEQVSAIESTLESEYVPFYFQDLRTNEIISFHAFLDDLSDSYSANYNQVGGYGRIDEVMTYKDTKRSIGFSFHVVATNPEDFDYMWWQINKLTSMVYPQWSKGRDLTSKVTLADFKYTQPFSQIPTATPVVRVRIGDLIRSNYSRFNLKRLFGYQDVEKEQSAATEVRTYIVQPGHYTPTDEGRPIKLSSKLTVAGPLKSRTVALGTAITATRLRSPWGEDHFEIFDPVSLKTLLVPPEKISLPQPVSAASGERVTLFYNPDNNSVVRSFETTRGYGLAGVVTQLGFTWMDQGILWGAGDDGPGNRAPRSCKVQVSFVPIHDIAPGLDHEGFNRAPIYPVGGLVNAIVEGGEPEPYGVGTLPKGGERAAVAATKVGYEELNKQTFIEKLF